MKCVTRELTRRSQSRNRSSTRPASAPEIPRSEPARPEVLLAQVPRVAHRRVAVADVDLAAGGAHALGHGVGARDHEVVAADVQRLDRARKQRQQRPEVPPDAGQSLQERRRRALAGKARARRGRKEIHEREQIGVRIDPQDLGQHVLAAAPRVEPVVDERDSHDANTGRMASGAGLSLNSIIICAFRRTLSARTRVGPIIVHLRAVG